MSGDGEAAAWARASHAAALFAVDPAGSGVSLRAPPGPARDAWVALLRDYLPSGAPMRRAPLSISDDRLLGGLDLAATLRAGRPVAETGLLAQADGGVLVLTMAERLGGATAARIAAALDCGEIELARDGLSARQHARIGVVALDEGHDDDERPPAALLDRLAFHLDLAEVSHRAVRERCASAAEVAAARARLPLVVAPAKAIDALVAAAARLGIDSLRAPLLALRVARASCALRCADVVDDEDLAVAACLALAPRATCAPPIEESEVPPEEAGDEPGAAKNDPDPKNDNAQPREAPAPDDLIVAAARAAIPADVLARLATDARTRAPSARGGKSGAALVSARRGRPMGARRGALREGRLCLIETLRAAAPWQPLRRAHAADDAGLAVRVRADDFRVTRFRERRETTAIFVVDASGSSAMQRLGEVKGAIELLLADCYVRRDSVALVAFRGKSAEILLPPTRSLARAKRLLAALPGGGGTPLAHGLDAAGALAESVKRKGQTPLLVLLTDGRGNIDRKGAPDRAKALDDALDAARRLRAPGLAALAIDSSPAAAARADAPTRKIAEAMNGRYLKMPFADAATLSQAVRAAAPAP
ncbi:magnesium chelatase subunit D [Methylocystis sp. SB2]|uniref:magnesium chelatase subunit D n=1 Tax=Methylocystis sp. (strain SB2) TaxID=743836 RepID=UPI0004045553|nr:magnesium chelatase subunit D [Methylocystis sp. SB2]ULO25314.1 magnesium chelatase subunit D [Methylocystis sp. SB2]